MKNIFQWILPVCLLVFSSGCKDETTVISIGETRNLITAISTSSAIMGDEITFSVKINQDNDSLAMDEDIAVSLTFTGTDVNGNAVTADDVFTGFSGKIDLQRGDKQGFTSFTVREDLTNYPISGTITAYARGYQMQNAERSIVISDKHYTIMSLQNNTDNKVNEYGKLILVATVGAPAKEDVTIKITPDSEDSFTNLPSELTVKAGYQTAESEIITVKGEEGKNSFESVALTFETTSETHPLYADKMTISVNDLDADLNEKEKLTDERWVYTNPDMVFVSSDNESAVANWNPTIDTQLMNVGDTHPNANLAAEGWTFLNAMEFSPIDALTAGGKENEWGNRVPRYMGEQNVAGTQDYQAIDNDKYSNMSSAGYLQMWCCYEPDGIEATIWNGTLGMKDYGTSALYANKFDGSSTGADSWENSNVRILPGMRVEVRARVKGEINTFNAAIWFQGNKFNVDTWPLYGEVDLLENPATGKGDNQAWQTFHFGKTDHNPSAKFYNADLSEFNIFWIEWRSNDEIAMGTNGVETIRIKPKGDDMYYIAPETTGGGMTGGWENEQWPFTQSYNSEGMHLLLTFACGVTWGGTTYDETAFKEMMKKYTYVNGNSLEDDYPRMEIDWIRYYINSDYQYLGSGNPMRNTPMY